MQFSEFQSTPPAEARGDSSLIVIANTPSGFQFTPPAEARGDTAYGSRHAHADGVSIHSPRRSEGRQLAERIAEYIREFQSTPPAEARGDPASLGDSRYGYSFQSTPPAEARGDNSLSRRWRLR